MSIFQRVSKMLASESGELKKVRMEAEKRRGSKSGEQPKVEEEVIDRAIENLSNRIDRSGR